MKSRQLLCLFTPILICLYLCSLSIQLFQTVNNLILLAQMQTEKKFRSICYWVLSFHMLAHQKSIRCPKSNCLKYKDCTCWSPDAKADRKKKKKAIISSFFNKNCTCASCFVSGSKTYLSDRTLVFLKKYWMGAKDQKKKKKKAFTFSGYHLSIFLTVILPIPLA